MLEATRIAVVGTGLMGGSLALSLRRRCAGIIGVDADPRALDLALRRGAVDRATGDLQAATADADCVILAVPVRASLSLLGRLAAIVHRPMVVLDLGSTKRAVVQAMDGLPANFDPIGGHPMCGKEQAGMQHADADLFRGAPFALTPLARTSPAACRLAEAIVRAIGARPVFMDAAHHDRAVAAVSHVPFLLSAALVRAAEAAGDPCVWQLAGPGFRDSTRLAASDGAVMLDILATNRDSILHHLAGLRAQLDSMAEALAAGDEPALRASLERARERRAELFPASRFSRRDEVNLWPGA